MGSKATEAKNRYNKKNYDSFLLMMPKGTKEKYSEIAEKSDMSLTSFIIQAIEEKIARE